MTYLKVPVEESGALPIPDSDCAMDEHSSFEAGYIAGWTAILGGSIVIPAIPTLPEIPVGRSPFQIGILHGIENAKHQIGVRHDG